eukprot:scaffold6778_cov129-Isochrysis_galbana.AAC.6
MSDVGVDPGPQRVPPTARGGRQAPQALGEPSELVAPPAALIGATGQPSSAGDAQASRPVRVRKESQTARDVREQEEARLAAEAEERVRRQAWKAAQMLVTQQNGRAAAAKREKALQKAEEKARRQVQKMIERDEARRGKDAELEEKRAAKEARDAARQDERKRQKAEEAAKRLLPPSAQTETGSPRALLAWLRPSVEGLLEVKPLLRPVLSSSLLANGAGQARSLASSELLARARPDAWRVSELERRGACGGKGGSGGRRGVALNCALGLFLANARGLCCLFASSCRERACECACSRRGARMCGLAPAARVHSKNMPSQPCPYSPWVQPTYTYMTPVAAAQQPQHKHKHTSVGCGAKTPRVPSTPPRTHTHTQMRRSGSAHRYACARMHICNGHVAQGTPTATAHSTKLRLTIFYLTCTPPHLSAHTKQNSHHPSSHEGRTLNSPFISDPLHMTYLTDYDLKPQTIQLYNINRPEISNKQAPASKTEHIRLLQHTKLTLLDSTQKGPPY